MAELNSKDELIILRQIVDLTASDLDLDGILNEVVRIVNDMTGADAVFLYLFDQIKAQLILMASKTPHEMELGKVYMEMGEGIAGWVARETQPLALEKNAYKDARFKHFDVLPEDQYEAILSVPIIYKGRSIGVINVQHKETHSYPEDMIDLIESIAKQVGGVIEHARLYNETKNKAMQFDSLMKVSESISSESYLDEILSLIVVVTAEMFNSKICSIMILDDKKNDELVIKATQSLSDEYKKKPNVKVSSSISGQALLSNKPIMVEDVCQESRYSYRDLAKRERLTSMIAVPMVVKETAIGVINVYTIEKHQFTQEEVNVLQMVANQAAVAVENTKLVEEAMKAKEALETRKLVERAKGILMKMHQLNENDAYRMIHKKSMDSCKSMKTIAESIILMDDFQKNT